MALNNIKKDRVINGLILGIIVPLIALYIQHLIKEYASNFLGFLQVLKANKPLLSASGSISLIANGLIFGILVQVKKFETARGVFIITCIMGIALLLYKFF